MAFMASPTNEDAAPPFEAAGGTAALGAGQTGWMDLNLPAGDYVTLCFVPDPATGKAHAEMGMMTPFSVK